MFHQSACKRPELELTVLPRTNGPHLAQLRCFNYNTHEKVVAFEAHPDYIRSLAVHPTGPFILTGSDDMTIKLWDWEKGWKNVQVSRMNVKRTWRARSVQEARLARTGTREAAKVSAQFSREAMRCVSRLMAQCQTSSNVAAPADGKSFPLHRIRPSRVTRTTS